MNPNLILAAIVYRMICALKGGNAQTVQDVAGHCKAEMETKLGFGRSK